MIPEISVIIATFNSSRTLKFTLQSLLNQDYSNFEAWIIGDACTDDSEAVVKSFSDPRLHWFNLATNSGDQATPNNEGLRRAIGQYITYLPHDDLLFPWHLSSLVKFIQDSNADLVYPLSIMKYPDQIRIYGPLTASSSYDYFYVPQTGLFHKRSLIDSGLKWRDPYSVNVPVGVEFLSEVNRNGYQIKFNPVFSVLKFPSQPWRMYDQKSPIPHETYYCQLTNNPEALEKSLLLEASIEMARMGVYPCITTIPRQIYFLFRQFIKKSLIKWYGKDRWPLSSIFYSQFHKQRRIGRIKRGLIN